MSIKNTHTDWLIGVMLHKVSKMRTSAYSNSYNSGAILHYVSIKAILFCA